MGAERHLTMKVGITAARGLVLEGVNTPRQPESQAMTALRTALYNTLHSARVARRNARAMDEAAARAFTPAARQELRVLVGTQH